LRRKNTSASAVSATSESICFSRRLSVLTLARLA
jgi:hypothetical protein